MNKIKESNIKNNIDPSVIDGVIYQANKLEKAIDVKII